MVYFAVGRRVFRQPAGNIRIHHDGHAGNTGARPEAARSIGAGGMSCPPLCLAEATVLAMCQPCSTKSPMTLLSTRITSV
jgi:hypothetical protein